MHESLKGKLKELWVSDENGKIFSMDKNTWQYRTLGTGIDGREVNFAYDTGTTNEIYEGDSNPVTLYTRFEYDDYGNTISELKYGIIDPNIPASDSNHFSIGKRRHTQSIEHQVQIPCWGMLCLGGGLYLPPHLQKKRHHSVNSCHLFSN